MQIAVSPVFPVHPVSPVNYLGRIEQETG